MIDSSTIAKMAEEKLQGTEIFLVDVSVKPGNRIFVFLDGDHGVTIEDCAVLSRHINNLIGEDEDHELVVSSSGADQPLKLTRQFRKNLGRGLTVKLMDESTVSGILEEVSEEGIVLHPEEKKKKKKELQLPPQRISIAFENIETAKVNISFNK